MADAKYRTRMPEPTPGGVFYRLTVVRRATADECVGMAVREPVWLCRCECGKARLVRTGSLRNSDTKSCGCFREYRSQTMHLTHGHSSRRGRGAQSPEYITWSQMKARCLNPKIAAFADYGGRGITVCDRWLGDDGFVNFLEDMGGKPSPKHSIDRIDNDKGYGPDNCRWVTRTEQANNKRNNIWLEHDGLRLTLPEWARRLGVSDSVIRSRIGRLGWPVSRAVTEPTRQKASPQGV